MRTSSDFKRLTKPEIRTVQGIIAACEIVCDKPDFTATQGVGGSSTGSGTSVLTLSDGTVHSDGSIVGDFLDLSLETIFAGGISNASDLSVSHSSLHLSGQAGGFVAENHVVVDDGTSIDSPFISFGHTSAGSTEIDDSDLESDGPGASDGLLYINGDATLTGVDADIQQMTDLAGRLRWSGGSLTSDLLRLHSNTATDKINFIGVALHSSFVRGALNGSSNPATVFMRGGTWTNSMSFASSGALSLQLGAHLTTQSLIADPEMGAGADIGVSDSGTRLLVKKTATVLSLTADEGADIKIGGDTSIVSFGSRVDGEGSTLTTRGKFALGGSFIVSDEAEVVSSNGVTFGTGVHANIKNARWDISGALSIQSDFDMLTVGVDGLLNADSVMIEEKSFNVTNGVASLQSLTGKNAAVAKVDHGGTLNLGEVKGDITIVIGDDSTLRVDGTATQQVTISYEKSASNALKRVAFNPPHILQP